MAIEGGLNRCTATFPGFPAITFTDAIGKRSLQITEGIRTNTQLFTESFTDQACEVIPRAPLPES